MKKITGILGVTLIAATMFFSTNNLNDIKSDASLAGLMNINVANAEDDSSDPHYSNYSRTSRIKTTTHYWKVAANGTYIAVSGSGEYSFTTTTQDTYYCCAYGGSDCSTSYRFC